MVEVGHCHAAGPRDGEDRQLIQRVAVWEEPGISALPVWLVARTQLGWCTSAGPALCPPGSHRHILAAPSPLRLLDSGHTATHCRTQEAGRVSGRASQGQRWKLLPSSLLSTSEDPTATEQCPQPHAQSCPKAYCSRFLHSPDRPVSTPRDAQYHRHIPPCVEA